MVCNYNEYNGEFFDNSDIEKVNSLHNGIQDELQPFIDANQESVVNRLSTNVNNNIKSEVSELFESNPELANTVYEALGFNQNNIEEFKGFWNREQVATQTNKVFLFGDNTNDRTVTNYVPSTTQAVIRGLPNAIGIDTKKDRGTSTTSYLTDADFDTFKNHVDSQIKLAKDSGKTIVIPADGIGTGKAMLKEKAPKLFEYLQQELNKLKQQQVVPQSFDKELAQKIQDKPEKSYSETEQVNNSLIEKIKSINASMQANVVTRDFNGNISIDVTPVLDKLLNRQESRYLPNLSLLSLSDNMFSRQLELLKRSLPGVEVILDSTITSKGRVEKKGDKITIYINPEKATEDTLIHEFGHILIDILIESGNAALIETAINQLRGTTLWESVAAAYEHLDPDTLGKEVLATAIGLEGAKEFNNITADQTKLRKIREFIRSILTTLKKLIGLNENVAKELARDLLRGNAITNNISLADIYESIELNRVDARKLDMNGIVEALINHSGRINTKQRTFTSTITNTQVRARVAITKMISTDTYDVTIDEQNMRLTAMAVLSIPPDKIALTIEEEADIQHYVNNLKTIRENNKLLGINLHKLVEDVFENTVDYTNYKKYFYGNTYLNNLPDKESQLFFSQMQTKIYTIMQSHPGAVFLTELAIFDETADMPTMGVIDLLVVNPDKSVVIYDLKTSNNFVRESNGEGRPSKEYMLNVYEKHAKQLYAYSAILKKLFNIDVSRQIIIPIKITIDNGVLKSLTFEQNLNVGTIANADRHKEAMFVKFKVLPRIELTSAEKINSLHAIVSKKISTVTTFINALKSNKSNAFDAAELQQILNELRFNQGLQTLLTNALLASELLKKVKANLEAKLAYHKNIEQVNNKIIAMPLSDLKEFYTVLKFLKHLTADNDNLSFLDDIDDNDVKSTVKEIRKLIAQLTVDVKETTTVVETHILDTVALLLVRETEIGMTTFRNKFQSDFEEQNPATSNAAGGITYYLGDKVVSKTQYENTKRNYIAQRVEEDQDNILVTRYEAAKKYVSLIPRDSDVISNTVLSAAESENFIIQTLYSILRRLDIDISNQMREFQVIYYDQMKEALSTHDKLVLGVGVAPSVIYDKYIEEDHIITEYSKNFYYGPGGFIEMQKKIKDVKEQINEAARQLNLVPESDLKARKTLESKILELNALSKDIYIKWKDKNIKKRLNVKGEIVSVPADHWKNPKYDKIKDDPIYNILISMVKDADRLLANPDLRLTKTIFQADFIKIPSKEKTGGENIFSGNFLQPLKSYFTKTNGGYNTEFGVDVEPEETLDYELVHLDTDEKPIKNISFPYRGLLGDTLEEHTANLSHDLFTSLMANYYVSLNFANKSKAKGDIELMLNVLGESQNSATIKRNWAGDVQKIETFKPVEIADSDIADAKAIFEKTIRENTVPNDKTNWYKLAEEIVEQRLLGIKLVGNPAAHAIVNVIHAVVVINTLTGSEIGAAMNAAQIITNIFEQAGRGSIITKEAVFKTFLNSIGRGLNPFNLKNNMADFFKSVPESKIGIITTALNGYKDSAMFDFDMLTGKLTKLIKLETANFLNNMVEYAGSNIIVESYLRSLIVQDIDGNSKGNLYDNIQTEHGRMIIPNGLYFHKDSPVTLEKLRTGISKLNDIISGYYDRQEVIPAKRTWYFKTLYLYRSWAPSVLLNRFRGLFTSFKELKEGDEYSSDERILYDAVLDQRLYGYETIWFRKALIKNLKTQLSNILVKLGKKAIEQETSDAFNKLDIDEKRAIMVGNRFILLRMLINLAGVIAVGLVVYTPDDDDEKEYKYLRSTLKEHEADLKSNKKDLETETDSEKIEALKKSIKGLESSIANLEAAIKNKDLSILDSRYIDTGVAAKLGKNNDAYKKHKDSYISKAVELNINDFYVPFTGKHLPVDKPLIRFDNNPQNWDELYKVATYIARYQDEISQFSLLTSVTPTNKAFHLQALQPVASAGKILKNPITGVSGITTTLDMVNLLSKNLIDTPSNVYQSSKSTIYGTDIKEQVRYASKDKLETIVNKMFPAFNRDYRELYKNIYSKTD